MAAQPGRMILDLSVGDAMPVSEAYEAREQERTRGYLESVHGTIPIDASEEGLAKSADSAAAVGGGKRLTPNAESTSEAVRATSEAQRATDDTTPMAADGLAALLGFKNAKDARTKLSAGIGLGDAMKMTDTAGNVGEAASRAQAKSFGLPDDLVEKIATAGGLASVLFPSPGDKVKKAADVGKAAGKALKSVADDTQGLRAAVVKALKDQRGSIGEAAEEAVQGEARVNTARINAPVDVKAVIENISRANAERMAASRKPVTHAETIEKSQQMTLQQALALDLSTTDIAAPQTAIRDHFNAAATYFTDLAKRAAAGDEAAKAEYWSAYTVAAELAAKDEGLGTNLGRGLNARRIQSEAGRARLDPEAFNQIAQTMAGATEAGIDIELHAKRMLALTPTQRKTALRQSITFLKAGQDALYEAWINGLLSGPQTHAANITSNTLTTLWAVPERLAAATLDVDALTKGRSVYFGETGAMLYGMVEGAKDGIRIAAKAMREGASAFGPEKVERAPAITATAFGVNPETAFGGAIDLLGAIIRTPGRALMTEDAFFKAVNYRMELRAAAYREAAAEGLRGKAFASRVAAIIADPPPAVKTRAEQFALTQTFNRELSDLGGVGGAAQGATTIANAVPLGRIVMPFIRTPANILHYASERTPVLNLLSDTLRADLMAGGARRAEALGKIGAGGTVSAIVATYAATAIDAETPVPYMTMITGEGPRDPKARATLERLGWKPYSVWNPYAGEYVSYRRTDPLGTVFGIVATATEMIGQLPEHGAAEIATATAVATSKAMLSKTFMEGLSNFLDTMEGNAGDFNRFAQGLARSAVPAGVRQGTRAVEDPVRRDMDSLFDHWRSGLPGYDGPADVNLWGDEILYSGGIGPDIVSPIYTSTVVRDDVDEYLAVNGIHFGKTPRVVGGTPPPGVRLEPEAAREGVKLTKEERHRLGVLIGKGGDAGSIGLDLGPLASQPPLKDVVRELMTAPGTDGRDGSRADFIRDAVNGRKRAAIDQLRRESPELDAELRRRERARIDKKIPTTTPAGFGPGLTIQGR